MKPTLLILTIALAATTSGAFAAPIAGDGDNGSMTAGAPNDASLAQQVEMEKARLDHAGFPQYNN